MHLNGFFVVKISNIQFYRDSIVCFRKNIVIRSFLINVNSV
ncbi:hypothetical protein LEP1GSC083_5077 [Leptospira interrogans serovar Pyrogenes str. L0374]|uniref:Uncharacterized protein n=3 Tax=Leptospira interrogans TaxID=173 RepID=M6ZDU4_LEPIR|nr:hypothetical protein LEP1GSC080_0421 [Leptospira interrogans str. FPW2026]EKO07311.1 hypothetical protein LEP1GSC077_0914 [Leptospira interrogans str. C10069]EMM79938.1 hypothetical protein LEP1GSC037_3962 [Leptospira interrogans str. 2006001854]EMN32292.1 hypothetical protein LEP1GSC083_5077 [Leptospira interrogans serovar Pyrogenes str. L0374]EMN64199.1 hypothetical protein LEP1GSC092_2520 [Leptospira interrogans serovar Pyrogenes str. R168]EMP04658.1 hypothetical protein LEP1GSC124_4577 